LCKEARLEYVEVIRETGLDIVSPQGYTGEGSVLEGSDVETVCEAPLLVYLVLSNYGLRMSDREAISKRQR
jgi:hypothetical protein